MSRNRGIVLSAALVVGSIGAMADDTADEKILAGAWSDQQVQAIADKTLQVQLPLVPGALSSAERAAASELLVAGQRLHDVYLRQLHPQAIAARDALARHPELAGHAALFRVFNGPIATTLDNQRVPFLGVEPDAPEKNVYPRGATRDALNVDSALHPETRADLLSARSIVQAATPQNRRQALATLDAHPALDELHPGLRARLTNAVTYLIVPYSVAYADDIQFVSERLNAAAALLESSDPAFARYLRLRGRDLLADDYDAGDAAWVTGRFSGNLNAQIGSYETYDDALFGVKTFFSLSLLQRDAARTAELAASIGDIQAIEDALPYESDRKVSSDIPIGVYNVMADFGQARGTNTATILPNEGRLVQQFGRRILIRGNILTNPQLNAGNQRAFVAATVDEQHGDFTSEGALYRTLWHEIGHYLGVNRTRDGRELDVALQDKADLLEELKADLVSLLAARELHERGAFDDARLRAVYADGIRRVLQKTRPRPDQPYQTMQLMQWNWFLAHGLLTLEGAGRMRIHYEQYDEAVSTLLAAVLELQAVGDRDAAGEFIAEWASWHESLHGAIAQRIREAETTRFALVRYEALGEQP